MAKKLFLLTFFLNLFLVSQFAHSEDSQVTISKIIIEGNQRVTNDTVLSYADISEGDLFTNEAIAALEILDSPNLSFRMNMD